MPNNRKHIQFYRNPSATTFTNASELMEGEIAIGLKPNHEKLFIKNAQGDIASFSSDAALNSLRNAMGITLGGDANDESQYSTQVPYLSGNTNMSDALNEVAIRASYALPACNTNFKVEKVTETVGNNTITSPKYSFNISSPVRNVSVTKIEDYTYTSLYTGTTQAYSGDVTITSAKEQYVLEFVPSEASNIRLQEILSLNVCCLAADSNATLTTGSSPQLDYILATEDEFEAHVETSTGDYIWILLPYGIGIKEITLDGFELVMEPTDMGTLSVGIGTLQCFRSRNQLIAGQWGINVKLTKTVARQIRTITTQESQDANVVNNTPLVYGGVVSIKPSTANVQSVFESFPDSNKILTSNYSKGTTFLDADKYYLYAVPGIRNLIVRHAGSDDIIIGCDSGLITLNGNTYSYVIVEKASIPWHFKIEAESPSEEVPIESLYAYGVQWDKTATSPDCTRIGNMDLHATLPIQSQMKGCLLNDHGDVVKYLPDSGWTEETLDGSLGQVMVELPEFWWKFSESGNTQSVMLSQVPLDGYKHVKKTYVSAYEATIDRGTDATGGTSHSTEWKLASVKNTTTRYRGGNNTASNDSAYNSQLGLPVTHMGMDSGRKAARLRKPSTYEWNIYTYQQHKVLWWLFVVEYATRYTQKPFDSTTTVSGIKMGGLGTGVTTANYAAITAFNSNSAFVPVGVTDSLGNGTGEVEYVSYSGEGASWATVKVPRYRGVENPFGHIWKNVDGISLVVESGDTGQSKVYVSDDPSTWNSDDVTGYRYVGTEARADGYIQEIFFGEDGDIWCVANGGNSEQYYTDQHNVRINADFGLRSMRVGGAAINTVSAGLAATLTQNGTKVPSSSTGFRLSFIPNAL